MCNRPFVRCRILLPGVLATCNAWPCLDVNPVSMFSTRLDRFYYSSICITLLIWIGSRGANLVIRVLSGPFNMALNFPRIIEICLFNRKLMAIGMGKISYCIK